MSTILLILMSIYISTVNGGAKYFKSPQFRNMLNSILNKPGGCRAPFVDHGIPFVGNKLFRRIYGVRAFYTWKCQEECHMPVIKKIRCQKSKILGGGDRPDQITASCECIGRLKKKRKCSTHSYSWSQIEAAHRQFCPTAYNTMKETSKTTTKTSTATTTKATTTSEPKTTKTIMTTATQTTEGISTRSAIETEKLTTYTPSETGSTAKLVRLRDMPVGRRDSSTRVIGIVTMLRSTQNYNSIEMQTGAGRTTPPGSQGIIGSSNMMNRETISLNSGRPTKFSNHMNTATALDLKSQTSKSLQSTNQGTSRYVSRFEEKSTHSNPTGLSGTSVTDFSTSALRSISTEILHHSIGQHTKFSATDITKETTTTKFDETSSEPVKATTAIGLTNILTASPKNLSSQSTVAFTSTVKQGNVTRIAFSNSGTHTMSSVTAGTSGSVTSRLQHSNRHLVKAFTNSELERTTTVSQQLGKVSLIYHATDASAGPGKQESTLVTSVPVETTENQTENRSQQSSSNNIAVSSSTVPSTTVIRLRQAILERTTDAALQSAVSFTSSPVWAIGQYTTVFVTRSEHQNMTSRSQQSESRNPATVSAGSAVTETTVDHTLTSSAELISRKFTFPTRITDTSGMLASSFSQSADQTVASSPTRSEEKSTMSSVKQLHIKLAVESTSTNEWTHSEMTTHPWISKRFTSSFVSSPWNRTTINILPLIGESTAPITFATMAGSTEKIIAKDQEITSSTHLKSASVSRASEATKLEQAVSRILSASISSAERKSETSRMPLMTSVLNEKHVPFAITTSTESSEEVHHTSRLYEETGEYVTRDAPMHESKPTTNGRRKFRPMQPISTTAETMGKTMIINSQLSLSISTVTGPTRFGTSILPTGQRSYQNSEQTIRSSATEGKTPSRFGEMQSLSFPVFSTTQTLNAVPSSSQWIDGQRFFTRGTLLYATSRQQHLVDQNFTDGVLSAIYKPSSKARWTITTSKVGSLEMVSNKFTHSPTANSIKRMQTMNSTISDKRPVTVSSIETDEKSTMGTMRKLISKAIIIWIPSESPQRISEIEASSNTSTVKDINIGNSVSVDGMTTLLATDYEPSNIANTLHPSTDQSTNLQTVKLSKKITTSNLEEKMKTSISRNMAGVMTRNVQQSDIKPLIASTSIVHETSAMNSAQLWLTGSLKTSSDNQKQTTVPRNPPGTENLQMINTDGRRTAQTTGVHSYVTYSPSVYTPIATTSDSKESSYKQSVSIPTKAKVHGMTASSQLELSSGTRTLTAYSDEFNASKSQTGHSSVGHISDFDTRAGRKHTGSTRQIQSRSSFMHFNDGMPNIMTNTSQQSSSQYATTFLTVTPASIKTQAFPLVATNSTGIPRQLIVSQEKSDSAANNLSLTIMNLSNFQTASTKSTIPTSNLPPSDNQTATPLPADEKSRPSNGIMFYSENNTLTSSLLQSHTQLKTSATARVTGKTMMNNTMSIDSTFRETPTDSNTAKKQTINLQYPGNRYTSIAENNEQPSNSRPVITPVIDQLNSATATSWTKSVESSTPTIQSTSYSSIGANSISTSFSGHIENETNAVSYSIGGSTLPTSRLKKSNSQDKTAIASSSRQWTNSDVGTYPNQDTFTSSFRQFSGGQKHITTTIKDRVSMNIFKSLTTKNVLISTDTLTTGKSKRSFSDYYSTQYIRQSNTETTPASTITQIKTSLAGGSQDWVSQHTKTRDTRMTESGTIISIPVTSDKLSTAFFSDDVSTFSPYMTTSTVNTNDTLLGSLNQARQINSTVRKVLEESASIHNLSSRKNIETKTANNATTEWITKLETSSAAPSVSETSTFPKSGMPYSQMWTGLSATVIHENWISFPTQTVTMLTSEQKTSIVTKKIVKQAMSSTQDVDGKSVSISSARGTSMLLSDLTSRIPKHTPTSTRIMSEEKKITSLDGLTSESSIISITQTSDNSRSRLNKSLGMQSAITYTTTRISGNTSERQLLSGSDIPSPTTSIGIESSSTPRTRTLANKPTGATAPTGTEERASRSEQLIFKSETPDMAHKSSGQNTIAYVTRFAAGDGISIQDKSIVMSTEATVPTVADNKVTFTTGSDPLSNKEVDPDVGTTKRVTVGSFLQTTNVLTDTSVVAGRYKTPTTNLINNEAIATSAVNGETITKTEAPRIVNDQLVMNHATTISVAQQQSTTNLHKLTDQLITSSSTSSLPSTAQMSKLPSSSYSMSAPTVKFLTLTTSSNKQQFSNRHTASSTALESGITSIDTRKVGLRTSVQQPVGLPYTTTSLTHHKKNAPTTSLKPSHSLLSIFTASMVTKLSPSLPKSETQLTASASFIAASLKQTTSRQEQVSTDRFENSTQEQTISLLQSIGQQMHVSATIAEGNDGRSLTSQQLRSKVGSISVVASSKQITNQKVTSSTPKPTEIKENNNPTYASTTQHTTSIISQASSSNLFTSQKQSSTYHSITMDSHHVTIVLNNTASFRQLDNEKQAGFPQDRNPTSTTILYRTTAYVPWATELESSNKMVTTTVAYETLTPVAGNSSSREINYPAQTTKRGTWSTLEQQERTSSINESDVLAISRIQSSSQMIYASTTKMESVTTKSNIQKSESESVSTPIDRRINNTTTAVKSWHVKTPTEFSDERAGVSSQISENETRKATTSNEILNTSQLSSNYSSHMNLFTTGETEGGVQQLNSKPAKMSMLRISSQSSQQARSQQVTTSSIDVTAADGVLSSQTLSDHYVQLLSQVNVSSTATNTYEQSYTRQLSSNTALSMLGSMFSSRYQLRTKMATGATNSEAAVQETEHRSSKQHAEDIPTEAQERMLNSFGPWQIKRATPISRVTWKNAMSSRTYPDNKAVTIPDFTTGAGTNEKIQGPSRPERETTPSSALFSSSTMNDREQTNWKFMSSRTTRDEKIEPTSASWQPSSSDVSIASAGSHGENAVTITMQTMIKSIRGKDNITSINYPHHTSRHRTTTLTGGTISLQQLIGQRVADFIVIHTSSTAKPRKKRLRKTYPFSNDTTNMMKSSASTQKEFESNVVSSNRQKSVTTEDSGIENRTVLFTTAALERTLNSSLNSNLSTFHINEESNIRQQSKVQKKTDVGYTSREQTIVKTVTYSDTTVTSDTSVLTNSIQRTSSIAKMKTTSISTETAKSLFKTSVSDSASAMSGVSLKSFSDQLIASSATSTEDNSSRLLNSYGEPNTTVNDISMRDLTASTQWSNSDQTSTPATMLAMEGSAIDAHKSNTVHITTTSDKGALNTMTMQKVSQLHSNSHQFWSTVIPTTVVTSSESTLLKQLSLTKTSTISETQIGVMNNKLQNITIVPSSDDTRASYIFTAGIEVLSNSTATAPVTAGANGNATKENSRPEQSNVIEILSPLTSRPETYFNDHYFQLDDTGVKNHIMESNETIG